MKNKLYNAKPRICNKIKYNKNYNLLNWKKKRDIYK